MLALVAFRINTLLNIKTPGDVFQFILGQFRYWKCGSSRLRHFFLRNDLLIMFPQVQFLRFKIFNSRLQCINEGAVVYLIESKCKCEKANGCSKKNGKKE